MTIRRKSEQQLGRQLLDKSQVMAKTSLTPTTTDRLEERGLFPKRIRLTYNRVAWNGTRWQSTPGLKPASPHRWPAPRWPMIRLPWRRHRSHSWSARSRSAGTCAIWPRPRQRGRAPTQAYGAGDMNASASLPATIAKLARLHRKRRGHPDDAEARIAAATAHGLLWPVRTKDLSTSPCSPVGPDPSPSTHPAAALPARCSYLRPLRGTTSTRKASRKSMPSWPRSRPAGAAP